MKGLKVKVNKEFEHHDRKSSSSDEINVYKEFKKNTKKIISKLSKKEDVELELGILQSLFPTNLNIYELGDEEGEVHFVRGIVYHQRSSFLC
jgi:hypothetical protein